MSTMVHRTMYGCCASKATRVTVRSTAHTEYHDHRKFDGDEAKHFLVTGSITLLETLGGKTFKLKLLTEGTA